MRPLVLIAASGADADAWRKEHIVVGGSVVVVTPRSIRAARGVTAFAILATTAGRLHPKYQEMLDDARPSVMAQVLR